MKPAAAAAAAADLAALLGAFDRQVRWCNGRAPFTARVLARSRAWLATDSAAAAAFCAAAADPLAAATPLRWAGALHHLALRGLQPWAGLWPPGHASAEPDDAGLDLAITSAWRQQRMHCDAALARAPQTNEVARSAALLPGLLWVAAANGLPLVLLEIGASAGLNLWCERYHHDHGAWRWAGDSDAELLLRSEWLGPAPELAPLAVQRRAACDAHPVDLRRPDEALRLASFIWPDQPERLERLLAAQRDTTRWMATDGVTVQAVPAARFVRDELSRLARGTTTVLMHSVVWQYIATDEQLAIEAAVQAAAAQAGPDTALAWLRLEPPAPDRGAELSCRLWDGSPGSGAEQRLALCHPHGARIEWLGTPPSVKQTT